MRNIQSTASNIFLSYTHMSHSQFRTNYGWNFFTYCILRGKSVLNDPFRQRSRSTLKCEWNIYQATGSFCGIRMWAKQCFQMRVLSREKRMKILTSAHMIWTSADRTITLCLQFGQIKRGNIVLRWNLFSHFGVRRIIIFVDSFLTRIVDDVHAFSDRVNSGVLKCGCIISMSPLFILALRKLRTPID